MAKVRKLLKALEAEGWTVVANRDGLVQLRHEEHDGRLTLPSGKISLPPDVAQTVADIGGIKLKGN